MSDRAACCPQCGMSIDEVKAVLQSTPTKDVPKEERNNIAEHGSSMNEAANSINASTMHQKKKRASTRSLVIIIVEVILLIVGGIAYFMLKNNEDTSIQETVVEDTDKEEPVTEYVDYVEATEESDNNNNYPEIIDEEYIIRAEANLESDLDYESTYNDEGSISQGQEVNVNFEENDENEIFKEVEKDPEFPGGDKAMYKFLGQNIKYPQLARENNITGRVYITFIVEKDGSVSNVRVLRDIGGGCGKEAARVVESMPKWTPGHHKGKNVRVQCNLPINFNL